MQFYVAGPQKCVFPWMQPYHSEPAVAVTRSGHQASPNPFLPPQASRFLSRIPPSLGFQLDCHSEKEAKAVLQESWNGGSLTPDGHGKNPCSPEIRYLTHNLAMLQLILILSLFITPLGWFESARSMHTFNSSWNKIFAF